MFRGQYDSDVTVWSPQGRLFQVEYAMEAVSQGTASVGLKSADYAVVVGLYKPTAEVGLTQPKIISVDKHVGICMAGITADARVLGKYLRTECLSYKHSYNSPYPITRLVRNLGNKMQISTQRYDRRPLGVGLLLAGYDEMGSHIYQIMPSANVFNCKAMAIGNRSQGAHTYLMHYANSFPFCSKDELICHGIQSISYAASVNEALNICVGIVGRDCPFRVMTPEESLSYQKTCRGPDYHEYPEYPQFPAYPDYAEYPENSEHSQQEENSNISENHTSANNPDEPGPSHPNPDVQ